MKTALRLFTCFTILFIFSCQKRSADKILPVVDPTHENAFLSSQKYYGEWLDEHDHLVSGNPVVNRYTEVVTITRYANDSVVVNNNSQTDHTIFSVTGRDTILIENAASKIEKDFLALYQFRADADSLNIEANIMETASCSEHYFSFHGKIGP